MNWYPSRFFDGGGSKSHRGDDRDDRDGQDSRGDRDSRDGRSSITPPYAIIILNQPINKPALTTLLVNASLVVCADGGGNGYLDFYLEQKRRYEEDISTESSTSTSKEETIQTKSTVSSTAVSTSKSKPKPKPRLPDAIIGDLDSLSFQSKHQWETLGVKIHHIVDDYSTDFTKTLKWIRGGRGKRGEDENDNDNNNNDDKNIAKPRNEKGEEEDDPKLDIIVLGGLGGRVDQAFSQIHHLLLAQRNKTLLNGRIYLVSEQSLSFFLEEGENNIFIDGLEAGVVNNNNNSNKTEKQRGEEEKRGGGGGGEERSSAHRMDRQLCSFSENVGVIPITGPSTITMSGFEWDVENWKTEFGDQLSTSNHVRRDQVMVKVEGGNWCLFTLELACHLRATKS